MMRRGISVLAVAALVLIGGAVGAQAQQCDFLTGGGTITTTRGAKANFAIGGSCKKGGDGHGLWGHLEYHDHGTGLNVHWTSITAYGEVFTGTDANGRPIGSRLICGTARTNQTPGEVNWAVTATDLGEPGTINNDAFSIHVLELAYSEAGPLQGGNIQLHKPNNSTGLFSDALPTVLNCPAGVTMECSEDTDCPDPLVCGSSGTCCVPGPGCNID